MGSFQRGLMVEQGYLADLTLGGFKLPNPLLIPGNRAFAGAATTDMYTVPVGRRAYFAGQSYLTGGGAVNNFIGLKINGIVYQMAAAGAWSATIGNLINIAQTPFLLEAGQSLSAVTNSVGGLAGQWWGNVIEFDSTSPLQQIFLTSLPANIPVPILNPQAPTRAWMLDIGLIGVQLIASGNMLRMYNGTGVNATVLINLTPAGGSTPQQLSSTAVNTTALAPTLSNPFTIPNLVMLNSGDLLTLTTNQAGSASNEYAWGAMASLPLF
jgi:hypothetical protein